MKLSVLTLSCWVSGHVLAAGVILGSGLAVQDRHLYRRAPARQPQSSKQSEETPIRPPKLKADVKADTHGRFKGSTFVKNEHGKYTVHGPNGSLQEALSRKKVSAGGTQDQPGKLSAEVSGPNVGIKLHVPKGSIGSYYVKRRNAEKTHHFVEHAESPFRWEVPKKLDGSSVIAGAEINGPGSVKAKAWN
ncbi:MAG: hypothetical protein GOMPHAMPRED_003379 [Gomphillus americanus]|uniref:Uncharacterized protein n=1 Tax=Gomphillus americanus TaxID=1940652 RepID=A0A8H3EHK2_9LECA|nr:MAG: hypothetical protein GOMPHAMPRED_003379 [Gomphillus americanus]